MTCNDDFIKFLERFGKCSCTVANANGYPGDLIRELLEMLWNSYCGDISLTCSDDGGLLDVNYYNIYLDLLLDGDVIKRFYW